MVAMRYAFSNIRRGLKDAAIAFEGFKISDDVSSSRRKNHQQATHAKRPGYSGVNVGISCISSHDLDAISIAIGWEKIILLSETRKAGESYPKGVFAPFPRTQDASCSESFSAYKNKCVLFPYVTLE